MEKGKNFYAGEATFILNQYNKKCDEWLELLKNIPFAQAYIISYETIHCQGKETFITSIEKLKKMIQVPN